tara:strand:- start:2164 stop:2448 length:285 start_codon:yes stop_codon:yes gene_type:complete
MIRQINYWQDIIEGDVIIWTKKDDNQAENSNWNKYRGHRLEIIELMDSCEDDECFHSIKAKTTSGIILNFDVDDHHEGLLDKVTIFRKVQDIAL